MSTPIIIGITGQAGTGKSTVSHELVRLYGFTKLAFADPLKGMLRTFLSSYGMSDHEVERHLDGDRKEHPCKALSGSSCRYALQTLGTEWGRHRINPKLWLHHLGARILSLPSELGERVVIDDVRMDNEAQYLLETFGLSAEIWEIDPLGHARRHPPSHASERGIDRGLISHKIVHEFTMPSLAVQLEANMERLGLDKRGVWAS